MTRRAPSLRVRVIRDPAPLDLPGWVEQYARAVLLLEGVAITGHVRTPALTDAA